MIYTQKIQHAIRFATKTHEEYQKQKRKGKDVPYITHPLTVGLILAAAGANEDIIIAGILHDTIEDSREDKKPFMPERIEERFGKKILDLVMSVTEQNKELSWEERKAEALEHIKTFSNDSLLLKSADVIANTSEIIDDYKKNGEEIFKRFKAPSKEKFLKNSLNVLNTIIEQSKENPLMSDLAEVRIQIARIYALESGPLSYIEWNISFIEYEIERLLQHSSVRVDVLNLCENTHQLFREYEVDNDISQLDNQLVQIISAFRKIVEDIKDDKKEFGMYFLLIAHIPDIMTSQKQFMDDNLKVEASEDDKRITDLYLDEEEQKNRKIVFVQCEDEEGCGFFVEFKFPNCTFFFCKEHKMGFNIDLNTVGDGVLCKQHGKMERYNVLTEDNVCPSCERNTLAILSTSIN